METGVEAMRNHFDLFDPYIQTKSTDGLPEVLDADEPVVIVVTLILLSEQLERLSVRACKQPAQRIERIIIDAHKPAALGVELLETVRQDELVTGRLGWHRNACGPHLGQFAKPERATKIDEAAINACASCGRCESGVGVHAHVCMDESVREALSAHMRKSSSRALSSAVRSDGRRARCAPADGSGSWSSTMVAEWHGPPGARFRNRLAALCA